MKLFIDYLSVVLFYIAYKFYVQVPAETILTMNSWLGLGLEVGDKSSAIYFAVLIGIVVAGLQTIIYWAIDGKPTKMHLVAFFAFLIFGGMTFFLRDPIFIKWKPTIVNAIFAIVFLGSIVIGDKTLPEHLMGKTIQVSKDVWHRLTLSWTAFFLFVAVLNIIVAYNFSEAAWVNFKLFGILGLTFSFLVIQALYLSKHLGIDNH